MRLFISNLDIALEDVLRAAAACSFVRLVAGAGFVLREKYCWLVGDDRFILREKYCWLVIDKPNEQGAGSCWPVGGWNI
jgi:hypothetical protein